MSNWPFFSLLAKAVIAKKGNIATAKIIAPNTVAPIAVQSLGKAKWAAKKAVTTISVAIENDSGDLAILTLEAVTINVWSLKKKRIFKATYVRDSWAAGEFGCCILILENVWIEFQSVLQFVIRLGIHKG